MTAQQTPKQTPSLYERVGGEPAIMAAVGIMYEKLVADDLTRPYFEKMEIDALVKKQIAFMAWALGGPEEYRGRDLRSAHAHLQGLDDRHFDAVVRHLSSTLRELEIDESLIGEIVAAIAPTRDEVLDR